MINRVERVTLRKYSEWRMEGLKLYWDHFMNTGFNFRKLIRAFWINIGRKMIAKYFSKKKKKKNAVACHTFIGTTWRSSVARLHCTRRVPVQFFSHGVQSDKTRHLSPVKSIYRARPLHWRNRFNSFCASLANRANNMSSYLLTVDVYRIVGA